MSLRYYQNIDGPGMFCEISINTAYDYFHSAERSPDSSKPDEKPLQKRHVTNIVASNILQNIMSATAYLMLQGDHFKRIYDMS